MIVFAYPAKTPVTYSGKIWEVDPLSCPRYGHEMKIISLINDPNLIRKILEHPGLWKPHPYPDARKPKVPSPGPVVVEGFDDGWPDYEEPAIMLH
jgi:hypothetical protein